MTLYIRSRGAYCSLMDAMVQVDVATTRPPRVHEQRHVLVTVDLPAVPTREDWWRAETEAREVASGITHARQRDVMPLAARIVWVVV